jgi:hypothetical protein
MRADNFDVPTRPPSRGRTAGLPFGFSDGQLEALKWLALASMFTDHIGRLLLGYSTQSWVFAAGRLAFPLFAAVLALNLARAGDRPARAARTALRLFAWGAVAYVPAVWARGDPLMFNVMGTLGLGAACCWALAADGRLWQRVLVLAGAGLAALHVEFGLPGVLLVAGVFLAATRPGVGTALVAAMLLAMVGWHNANFGGAAALLGTLASAVALLVARAFTLRVMRLKWVFYAVYPVHLAVIGALKAIV